MTTDIQEEIDTEQIVAALRTLSVGDPLNYEGNAEAGTKLVFERLVGDLQRGGFIDALREHRAAVDEWTAIQEMERGGVADVLLLGADQRLTETSRVLTEMCQHEPSRQYIELAAKLSGAIGDES